MVTMELIVWFKVNIVDEIIITFGPNQSFVRCVTLSINLNMNHILHLGRLSIVLTGTNRISSSKINVCVFTLI